MTEIENLFYKIVNPQVYTGLEINCKKGDFKEENLNICLVFPDKYEIGMSHQGLKILYQLLGEMDGVNVERAFLPDRHSMEVFQNEEILLFSLENRKYLKDFDLIGFSVLSELSYTNILLTLELSGIPLKTEERAGNFPLIAAGGISVASNPEPVREFIDIIAIGDGEILFPQIIEKLKTLKKNGGKKDLSVFEKHEGIYVPSLHPVKKVGKFYISADFKSPVKKSVIRELENVFKKSGMIVPITDVVFNRLETEIARGCPQNCRFCQAKAYYSPFRVKSESVISDEYKHQLAETGFESMSFSSLSSGDHPAIDRLVEGATLFSGSCISVSLPSLRPSTLSESMLSSISKFRKTGITIVPEAGSDRLRKVINKNVTDEEILDAVERLISGGWQRIKFYFMLGLPTETNEDIESIILLVEKIVGISKELKKNIRINLSFSPFVPKPHTVFQWSEREKTEVILERIGMLRNGFKRYKNVKVDFHRIEKGIVETILARGDARVGNLIERAFKEGELFTAWDMDFNYSVWESIIREHNLDLFLEEFSTDEILPWDFIELGYKKEFLKSEYKRALKGEIMLSCIDLKCSECNGCDFKFNKLPMTNNKIDEGVKNHTFPLNEFKRIRLFFKKDGDFRFLSHLSIMKYVERIIRKTGILFRCTEGHHPRIKMAAPPPIPIFAVGDDEVFELFVSKDISSEELFEKIRERSGKLIINRVVDIKENEKKLTRAIVYTIYQYIGEISKDIRNGILYLAEENDTIIFSKRKTDFKIYYPLKGTERFAKMYRMIDPERKMCMGLRRKGFVFES